MPTLETRQQELSRAIAILKAELMKEAIPMAHYILAVMLGIIIGGIAGQV